MPGTAFPLEINPRIPDRLSRLGELANDLWYSWDRPTRTLFARLDSAVWHAVGHSPKAFLKGVDQRVLENAADDPVFVNSYLRVLSSYDTYHGQKARVNGAAALGPDDLVAYFCAEFGFHESLPIYSGGLGILAGDHCKAASDMRLPFVGVGLLYRQGYFWQTIDNDGQQQASYSDSDFTDLPIEPVMDAEGHELHVHVELPGRSVWVKVWQARVGHVRLYLLDTDLERNTHADRDIAHRLYGGDRTTRIEQEIVLGVGGGRALAAMGLRPTVWHINEGHAAFLILERVRALVAAGGVDFGTALELVASNTVFTTHTAVPAGHDHFADETIEHYFGGWCREVGIPVEQLTALGRTPSSHEFNMTALAIRGSRHHNGVSRIHRGVSAAICAPLWPQIEPDENPIDSITNGVHIPTFLSDEWAELFTRQMGSGWSQRATDPASWEGVHRLPDLQYWSVRLSLKAQMLHLVRHRIAAAHARNRGSEAHLDRLLRLADPANPDVLTIGFARRFATYKRAALLFENLDWLRELVSDRKRPVLFVFAGKAHPADEPGKSLIRRLHEVASMREFEGHLLLVEGYDLRLGRRLVQGVDVWLNNPIYPLEASGTSGMKAALNGVINLSVLDGWWDEGYDGANGWAIKPVHETLDDAKRSHDEARTLYEILQDKVIPLYYERGATGFSPGWVAMSKRSMASIAPRFNAARMLGEYVDKFYVPAARQFRHCSADDFESAGQLAHWKGRVRHAWDGVVLELLQAAPAHMQFGEHARIQVRVRLNGLEPADVCVEMLVGARGPHGVAPARHQLLLHLDGPVQDGAATYALELSPDWCGKTEYRVRAYPVHPHLTHRFELGLMRWL
jgi:starch phosphorylase